MTMQANPRRATLSCGTLSYRQEPLARALEGIARAGFPGEIIDQGIAKSYRFIQQLNLVESV